MSVQSSSLSSVEYWTLCGLAGLALVLVVVNSWVSGGNRDLQSEIQAQQQYINETVQLSRLNSQVIQTLAELSVQTGDKEIGRLLTSQGITFSAQPRAESPAGESATGTGE